MLDRIRALCKEKGITIAELERRCGIGNGIVARWNKSKPAYNRILKVAEELGTTPEYLLTGEQKEQLAPEGELDEKDLRLISWFRSLPPEKQKAILNLGDGPKDAAD